MINRLRVNKLGVLSIAKLQAVIGLVFGLLIGVPYGLFVIIFSLIGAGGAGGDAAVFVFGGGIVIGVALVIGIPLGYALMMFIAGAFGALIYNLLAAIVGGIEIEVENVD